ncbi:MAG: penicillin-binding protein 2 [Holosporaceae bacterium]|jgi:cell division protein FtsI (penicillin-binding protein 3)|nr:penicillin-binding protein 2 [Holosporaceae bacterium]
MYKGYGNNLYSISTQPLKVARQRVLFVVSIFLLAFLALVCRLAQVMILNDKEEKRRFEFVPPTISRADIVDRNGTIIATSLPTVSLYACPREIISVEEAAEKIAAALDLNKADLKKKLSSQKKFLWIKRNLSPVQEQAVLNQGIPGIHFLKTERRVYPDKNLFSHVIGGTDVDNVGIAGIEKVFDESLRESSEPIKLSVDVKIQHAVRDELQKSVEEFKALAGAAVVMKISTGEIISLVSFPDFDPNAISDPKAKERFNMITSSAIEPGSSAKVFNTAMAIESGLVAPYTTFDARFPLKVGKFVVHDFKGLGKILTVEEILKFSSNIGSAKIALEVGRAYQRKFFKNVGLLDAVSCELPETQRPLYPALWTEVSSITISYGHGIAFSPLHMITVMSGILNDGILNNPTLLKRDNVASGRRIISKRTSNIMKALLRIDVIEGRNKFAEVSGYCVGGKTGTAEKQKGGKYLKNSNYGGFIGAFPMTNPQYAVYVVLDDPQATPKTHGYKTAGWNAAPTAANIIKRIGSMLGVVASNGPEPDWKSIMRKEV